MTQFPTTPKTDHWHINIQLYLNNPTGTTTDPTKARFIAMLKLFTFLPTQEDKLSI